MKDFWDYTLYTQIRKLVFPFQLKSHADILLVRQHIIPGISSLGRQLRNQAKGKVARVWLSI